ncbi:MAG: radical SAM protein [Candidatus Aminicenantes bacterium]|nr:radical SAM protein [Candidatus Aminicenantes bacterium]
MRRYSGHAEPWGKFVDVKINGPELLKRQLSRARRGSIWIASVCDAYQPLEEKYQLTRKCLQEIIPWQFPVFIQTKSDLVVRDLDLLTEFQELEVGFSLATDSDKVAALFEPGAPSITRRIKALEKIKAKSIRTFVFIGPLLPLNPTRLIKLISGLADKVFLDRLNYAEQFLKFYLEHGLEKFYQESYFQNTAQELVALAQAEGIETEKLF